MEAPRQAGTAEGPSDKLARHLPACLPLSPLVPTPDYVSPPSTGSRALWGAVFELAVREFQRADKLSPPAFTWLCSEEQQIGSCRWICDMLGLDHFWICGQLRKAESLHGHLRRRIVGGVRHQINGKHSEPPAFTTARIYTDKSCQTCGDPFTPTGPSAKWCAKCRVSSANWNHQSLERRAKMLNRPPDYAKHVSQKPPESLEEIPDLLTVKVSVL